MQLGHRFWKKSAGKDLLAIIIGSSSASCDLSRGGRSSIERQRNVSRTSSFGIGEGNAVEHSEAWMEVWPLLSWTLEHRPTPRCLLLKYMKFDHVFFSSSWSSGALAAILFDLKSCLFRENGVTWEFKHQQTNYGNNNLTTIIKHLFLQFTSSFHFPDLVFHTPKDSCRWSVASIGDPIGWTWQLSRNVCWWTGNRCVFQRKKKGFKKRHGTSAKLHVSFRGWPL